MFSISSDDDALAVGRALVDLDVAVAGVDRVDELGGGRGEVRFACARRRSDCRAATIRLGDLALVERLGPALGDPPQRAGQGRKAHHAALLGGFAAGQVVVAATLAAVDGGLVRGASRTPPAA